jgi:hypothetical protein
MTSEQVFKLYRGYKFYYAGTVRFDHGQPVLRHPPFIDQPDRQFYYRLSVKMSDDAIHALFATAFFFDPTLHASKLVSPEMQKLGLYYAARAENGTTLYRHELYELAKQLSTAEDIDAWLYGEREGHIRADMPGCLQAVISGELALDLACMLLLVSQPHLDYNWPAYWSHRTSCSIGLGPHEWITRLSKLDQLFNMQRSGWRATTHELADEFWNTRGRPLAPLPTTDSVHALF